MEGQRIGNYRIVRKIGQGGMGSVWEAKHEQLHRKAAIKLLRRELTTDPQVEIRFFNEAKAASRVDHPSIVKIDEFGHLPDGTAYIIMEFLSGDPLSVRLRNLGGKLQIPDTLRISRQIASALAATHAKGIVHRDAYEKTMTCFRVSAKDAHRRRTSHGYTEAEDSSDSPLQLV